MKTSAHYTTLIKVFHLFVLSCLVKVQASTNKCMQQVLNNYYLFLPIYMKEKQRAKLLLLILQKSSCHVRLNHARANARD